MFSFFNGPETMLMEIRETYQKKAGAQLKEWQGWIEQIKREITSRSGVKFAEEQQIILNLENCHSKARMRLEELGTAHESHWELAKQGVERAMIDLKQALDQIGPNHSGKFLELQDNRSRSNEPFYRKV
jgi:hypothetical protein